MAGVPGDIKFKDLNGDDKIGPDDRSIVGYTKPNYSVGFSNTFTYKNFQLYSMIGVTAGGGKDNFYIGSNYYANNPEPCIPELRTGWIRNIGHLKRLRIRFLRPNLQ